MQQPQQGYYGAPAAATYPPASYGGGLGYDPNAAYYGAAAASYGAVAANPYGAVAATATPSTLLILSLTYIYYIYTLLLY